MLQVPHAGNIRPKERRIRRLFAAILGLVLGYAALAVKMAKRRAAMLRAPAGDQLEEPRDAIAVCNVAGQTRTLTAQRPDIHWLPPPPPPPPPYVTLPTRYI
jgi:hypothetical protein